jgi:hypothetical protein
VPLREIVTPPGPLRRTFVPIPFVFPEELLPSKVVTEAVEIIIMRIM